MRIAIVQFPGSNCERETSLAVERAGMTAVSFLWNDSPDILTHCDGFIIVGGFSYEDRSRAGVIASLDPIMSVIKQQSELGKPVLGICNGAQILVETGLVPGLHDYGVHMVLTDNKRIQNGRVLGTGYYNAQVHLKLADRCKTTAFTRLLKPDTCLAMPVAHGEGRFVIPADLLQLIQAEGLGVFQYCTAQGEVSAAFPVNPNGSTDNLAAIANAAGNVLAIMPHPERVSAGDTLFHSMRDYITSGYQPHHSPLHYKPEPAAIQRFQRPVDRHEWVVGLIISDNQAMTVENTLKYQGIPVTITRHDHWEIGCDSPDTLRQIANSGLLFNDRKERLLKPASHPGQTSFLTRSRDDLKGLQKMQQLQRHFGVEGLYSLRHSVLWHLGAEPAVLETAARRVLDLGILYNASSHECFNYG